jgi:hypothetical protein
MSIPLEILRDLDELVRTDLQGLRDSYFHWLLIATWAVLIGVLVEGPEVVRDLRDGFLMWRKRPPAHSHHPFWILILSSVGWFLISVGVVGEGIFESLVSKGDVLVQTFNDILLGAAERQAADAILRAQKLEVVSKQADVKLLEAQRGVAEANKKVAEANERTAKIQLELTNLITWRSDRLNGVHAGQVLAKLKAFPGTPFVLSVYNDPESIRLCEGLDNVLRSAGWIRKVNAERAYGIDIGGMATPFVIGSYLTIISDSPQFTAWDALRRVLKELGIMTMSMARGTPLTVLPVEQQRPMQVICGQK